MGYQGKLRRAGHRKIEGNPGESELTEFKGESILKRRARPIMSNTVKKSYKMKNQNFF